MPMQPRPIAEISRPARRRVCMVTARSTSGWRGPGRRRTASRRDDNTRSDGDAMQVALPHPREMLGPTNASHHLDADRAPGVKGAELDVRAGLDARGGG